MPIIRVKEYYSGRLTGERKITPGDYQEGDPLLFGIEDVLIEKKVAIRIDEPLPVVTQEQEPVPDDEPDETEPEFVDLEYGINDPKNAHDWRVEPEHKPVTHEEALKQFEVEREKVTQRASKRKK